MNLKLIPQTMIIGAENVKRPSMRTEKMTKVLKFKVIQMGKNRWITLTITIVSAFLCRCAKSPSRVTLSM